jgi:hypothetical protein
MTADDGRTHTFQGLYDSKRKLILYGVKAVSLPLRGENQRL